MPTMSKKDQLLKLEIDKYLSEHFIADTVVKTDMPSLVNMAKHFAKFGEGLQLKPTCDNEELLCGESYADRLKYIEDAEEELETYMSCGIW